MTVLAPRIACLLGEGFEDSEFRLPYNALRHGGMTVDIIGAEHGQTLTGYHHHETVEVDAAIDGVQANGYDGLLIPGGSSPERLRADPRFVQFVRDFDKTKRPVAAICHGPQLLISAGLVRGRTLTAYCTIQEDLRQIGAHVRDQAVVVDDNWITSRTPADLPEFIEAFLTHLTTESDVERMEHRPIGQPLQP